MVQGKFKPKKLPEGLKKKQKRKGIAFTRRPNAPIQPKKNKFTEQQKIKQAIQKTVNKSVEEEIRSRAVESQKNISKAQEAVIKENSNTRSSAGSSSTAASTSTA